MRGIEALEDAFAILRIYPDVPILVCIIGGTKKPVVLMPLQSAERASG